jgi:hypothetical protein
VAFLCLLEIEKGGEISTLFVPNLTINLTYLCYGMAKLLVLWEIKKEMSKKLVSFSSIVRIKKESECLNVTLR